MATNNFSKWKAWTQSLQIKVVVGTQQEIFLVPRDLLGNRSKLFRKWLDTNESFSFPHTESSTFDDFYRWSLREDPCIWEDIQQERLEKLGIFAEMYHIPALIHQVVDEFYKKLKSSKWRLQPDMVRRVYQTFGPDSCLRKMVKAALGLVSAAQLIERQSDWDILVYGGGDAAVDIFQAVLAARNTHTQSQRLYGSFRVSIDDGPCRFHKHLGESLDGYRQPGGYFHVQECPFRARECFPGETILTGSGQNNGPATGSSRKEKKLMKKMKSMMAKREETTPADEALPAKEAFPAEEACIMEAIRACITEEAVHAEEACITEEEAVRAEEACITEEEAVRAEEACIMEEEAVRAEEACITEVTEEAMRAEDAFPEEKVFIAEALTAEEASAGEPPTEHAVSDEVLGGQSPATEILVSSPSNSLDWTVLDG